MGKSSKYREAKPRELLSLTPKESRGLWMRSIFVVVILNYFFYRSVLALLPLSYIGIQYFKLEKKAMRKKKREEAKEQFKELLLLVSNGQRAGYSVENAFLSSYREMETLYGKDSIICKMLERIRIAKENRQPLPEIWFEIGRQTGILEIQEFARVYDISYQKSGNVAAVMEKTAGIIVEKIETEKEISLLLSAKRMEQKIMNLMPFLIMLYMGLVYPGYFDRLYHNPGGVLIMSICLGIYLLAYRASLKIVDIHL